MPVHNGEESKAVANEFGTPSNGLQKTDPYYLQREKKDSVVLQRLYCMYYNVGEGKNWCCFLLKTLA